MRIALVSDIHGNLPALLAVMEDITSRSVDAVVNLGDSLSGPLLPAETANYLMRQDWIQLAGNHERQLLHFSPETGAESDRFALTKLASTALSWLATLPGTARVANNEVLLCHGTPDSDVHYFLESVDREGMRPANAAEIEARCGDAAARVICCGHTHVARICRRENGTLLVNPGSVGLQAYDDGHPYPHVIENGSPDARYAIIERHANDWRAALLCVPYDHEGMARLAEQNNRPDWAIALRYGYMHR